jgi:FkbM family methyltransferase
MMRLSGLRYYLASIPTLLWGIKNWSAMLSLARRHPAIVRLRQPALSFHARSLMDVWIIKETCLDRDYENLGGQLQDGWTVMDIGAALGDFSVYVARQYRRSTVFAYEPFPESFELLQKNIALNRVTNVHSFACAVGDGRSATLTLARTGEAVQHRLTSTADPATQTVEVPSTTLDEILAEHSHCDFLKIDVEGAEYGILLSTSDVALSRIHRVCLEYHNGVTEYAHTDLLRFFQEKGFQVMTRPNPVHQQLGLIYAWK